MNELLKNNSSASNHGDDFAEFVLAHTKVALAVFAADGALRLANPAFETLLGYAAGALASAGIGCLTSPDTVAKLRDPAAAGLDCRFQRADGVDIWVSAIPSHLPDGGLILQLLDIERQKATEAEMATLSQRLEFALEVSRIGVWEQDITSGAILWDSRMRQLYGLSADERRLDVNDWEHALHPDDHAKAKADFDGAIATGADYSSQFRIRLPDGRVRHLRSRARLFNDALNARHLVGAEWDVTEDIEQAEELRRAQALAEMRYQALMDAQAHVQHAALHDYLTDLPNRRFLDQMLTERRDLARARADRLAVMHIDLDHFKDVNDTLGHAAGDALLRHVADVLRHAVREGDFISRIGGDEFVVLSWFSGDRADLGGMATRIIAELDGDFIHSGRALRIGASIGIAYAHSAVVTTERLLQRADKALYRAKYGGRNRYEFAA